MNQQLKVRLVGAVVLVSLAIIFIPMLLDGGDRERAPLVGQFMPDRPDYHFEPLEIPLRPVAPVPPEQPRLVDPVAPLEPVVAEAAPDEADTEPPPPPPPPPAVTASPPPSPAPAASPPPTVGAVGWVVQVGSFSRRENALALQDRLREHGFTAFIDQAGSPAGVTWRVRVGPELKRENAEKHRTRLQNELQIDGIVMGHTS